MFRVEHVIAYIHVLSVHAKKITFICMNIQCVITGTITQPRHHYSFSMLTKWQFYNCQQFHTLLSVLIRIVELHEKISWYLNFVA